MYFWSGSPFPPSRPLSNLESKRGLLPSMRPNPTFLPPPSSHPVSLTHTHTTPFPECSTPPKKPKWTENIPQPEIYFKKKKEKKGKTHLFPRQGPNKRHVEHESREPAFPEMSSQRQNGGNARLRRPKRARCIISQRQLLTPLLLIRRLFLVPRTINERNTLR